jgi:hypothetical protein
MKGGLLEHGTTMKYGIAIPNGGFGVWVPLPKGLRGFGCVDGVRNARPWLRRGGQTRHLFPVVVMSRY